MTLKVSITSISFISSKCFMCDKPWKHKVYAEGVDSPLYLCDEHLEHAKKKWKRRVRVAITKPDVAYRGKTE